MIALRYPPLWMAPTTRRFSRSRFPEGFPLLSVAHVFFRASPFPIFPPLPFSPAQHPKWKHLLLCRRLCFHRSLAVLIPHKIFHISPYPETPEWKIASVQYFVLLPADRR